MNEFRVDGKLSEASHVSERARIVMFSSEINSWRREGLSMLLETEATERILRWAKLWVVVEGPGFKLMSPERIRSVKKKFVDLGEYK